MLRTQGNGRAMSHTSNLGNATIPCLKTNAQTSLSPQLLKSHDHALDLNQGKATESQALSENAICDMYLYRFPRVNVFLGRQVQMFKQPMECCHFSI